MWREGVRPRESERIHRRINEIGDQVAKDTGFYVNENEHPSEKLKPILKKLLNQRLLNILSAH